MVVDVIIGLDFLYLFERQQFLGLLLLGVLALVLVYYSLLLIKIILN